MDYMVPLFTTSLYVAKTKETKTMNGPILTIAEQNRRNETFTACMYRLEMMRHKNGCRAFSPEQLDRWKSTL